MKSFELLRALEGWAFEVALLVVTLPRTVFIAAFRPSRVQPFVSAEWKKPTESRFDGFASPIIVWILMCVLPYHYLAERVARHAPVLHAKNIDVDVYRSLPWEARLAVVVLFWLVWPVAFALMYQWARKEPFETDSFKRLLYIQFLHMVPFAFLIAPSFLVLLAEKLGGRPIATSTHHVAMTSDLLATGVLLYGQLRSVCNETPHGWRRFGAVFGGLSLGLVAGAVVWLTLFNAGRLYAAIR